MKNFLILFLMFLVFVNITSCGSDSGKSNSGASSETVSMNGVLIQPTIKIGANATITKKLPLQLWDWSGETRRLTVSADYPGVASGKKPEFCVIEGDGKELSVGAEVVALEEAICTWVLYSKNGFKKYNVGLKKIRIESTGEEGWTWSSAVQKSE